MPRTSAARSVQQEEFDRTVKPEFADCRSYLHAWRPLRVHEEGVLVVQTLICTRCGTERDQEFNRRTHKSQRRGAYRHPEGYLFKGGGRFTAEERDDVQWKGLQSFIVERAELSAQRRKNGEAADPEAEKLAKLLEFKPLAAKKVSAAVPRKKPAAAPRGQAARSRKQPVKRKRTGS